MQVKLSQKMCDYLGGTFGLIFTAPNASHDINQYIKSGLQMRGNTPGMVAGTLRSPCVHIV